MRRPTFSSTSSGRPLNPVFSTVVICEYGEPRPEAEYFVGFLYNNAEGDSFIVTAEHCILADENVIYPRFRSSDDPRALSTKRVDLWKNGKPIWKEHPHADLAAIPLKIDIPEYNNSEIVYDDPWPAEYEQVDFSEDAEVYESVYASAFTRDNIPKGRFSSGYRLPFAGDEVSIICYDKTRDREAPYGERKPPSNQPLPKIRDLTISTPYRLDYNDSPVFLNDGRLFMGSSGVPVLYIPPAEVYSEKVSRRTRIENPLLIGVHGHIVERTIDNKQLNLFEAVRAEEILPITERKFDWDTTPTL